MALRQTYLSLKRKLPPEAEAVLVMRGRGNDELAPSKALFDEFKRREAACRDTAGDPAEAAWRAFREADYEGRFTAEILGSDAARARLGELARRSRERDVFLVCYVRVRQAVPPPAAAPDRTGRVRRRCG